MYRYTVKEEIVKKMTYLPYWGPEWKRWPDWQCYDLFVAPLMSESSPKYIFRQAFREVQHFCFYSENGNLDKVYMNGWPFPIALFTVVKI